MTRFGAVKDPGPDVVRRDAAQLLFPVGTPQPGQKGRHIVSVVADGQRRIASLGLEISDKFIKHTGKDTKKALPL